MAKANILIVEDEGIVALVIKNTLQSLGYAVSAVAASGQEAIERVAETGPDLVLMDIRLKGGMDGLEAAEQIRARFDIPVIYLTAFADEDTLERAKVTEPFGYVLKPFDERELYTAVEIALYRHSMEKQLKEREQEIRHRVRELCVLNQVIAASASGLAPERILETACRELAQALDLPHVVVTLLNDERTSAVVAAEYRAKGWPSALNRVVSLPGHPSAGTPLPHQTSPAIVDAKGAPRLVLPIMIEGDAVGNLELSGAAPRRFSPEEISLSLNVARQVAGALARARAEEKRRKLEEQFYQAQKMEALGRLTGGVAHEFNNLLTVMNGFTEFLQLDLPPDSPLHELTAKIAHAGRRAAGLVRQLLAFSRTQVIMPQVLSLNHIVTEMYDMLWRIIGEDIQMETVLAADLWTVQVDPAQMELVIINLVINARDAMPYGGRLILKTENVALDEGTPHQLPPGRGEGEGGYVLLTVSDTGAGMKPEVKTHIFEPFFTTKGVGGGTGLGLATVHGIVKQSGGDISCYSDEGVGTTFKIYLPRTQAAIQPENRPRVAPMLPYGNETLLMVEDDDNVRDLARQVLGKRGYTLLEAGNGPEALGVATGHPGPIHLLLTDLVMPGMNGRVLARQLARSRPDIKTLFISGYSGEIISHHGLLEPDVAFLPKPFSAADLACKVRSVLDD